MKKVILMMLILFCAPSAFAQSNNGSYLQCYTGSIGSPGTVTNPGVSSQTTHMYATSCYYVFPGGGGNTGGGSGGNTGGGSGGPTPQPVATVVHRSATNTTVSCSFELDVRQRAAQQSFLPQNAYGAIGSTIRMRFSDGSQTFVRTTTTGSYQFAAASECVFSGNGGGGPTP